MNVIIKIYKSRRGSGIVLGLLVLMMVFVLGGSVLTLSVSSLLNSKREVTRASALACAEAGIEKAQSFLMFGGPNGEASGAWRTTHPSTSPDNHSGDTWYTGSLSSDESYKVCAKNGSGITAGKIVVTSIGTATYGDISISRTIKVVLDYNKKNVGVWNNVIFGGVGQAGKSINGNVAINGSIHLLGDGEDFQDLDNDTRWDNNELYLDINNNGQYDLGEPYTDVDKDGHRDSREPFTDTNGNGTRDPALTVTDLAEEISGNASIGNNYSQMGADLLSHVPSLPQKNFGGEMVSTLDAVLRVKHGKVNISGSAVVGSTNQTSNSIKETMDSVYVSDGFGGNAGVSSVHSDNGYSNGYDLGDGLVKMPVIDSGAYTKDGVTYSNYLSYLEATATVYSGDLSILKGTAKSITGPNGSLTIDAAGNMTITGKVYVTGNISFGPKGTRILYSGSGSLITPGNVSVHCDLLTAGKFPTDGALGLIAGNQINLATGSGDSQLTMAIAMYAQHKVVSSKQSQIAGTIVSSYFEMSNVPSIFQVPELVNNLPPGLPGADPIWIGSISTESWQEK